MADVEITALPWAELWKNANPSNRSLFLQDQEELYGNCPCRGPADIYSDQAPELCKCQTGEKVGTGAGGSAPATSAGVAPGFLPLPGLGMLGQVPAWVWWAALAVVAAAILTGRRARA